MYYKIVPYIRSDKKEIGLISLSKEIITCPEDMNEDELYDLARALKEKDKNELEWPIEEVRIFQITEIGKI